MRRCVVFLLCPVRCVNHEPAAVLRCCLALCRYWDRERLDTATGCYVWWDQMESGADDLPTTVVPSNHTPTWDPDRDCLSLSAPDVMVFMHREHTAFARFLTAWAAAAAAAGDATQAEAFTVEAATHSATAGKIEAALNAVMWSEELGHYVAYDVKRKVQVLNRTFLMAFPLYGGLADDAKAKRVLEQLKRADMWSAWGVRSTSSADERYTNVVRMARCWDCPGRVVAMNAAGAAPAGACAEHHRAVFQLAWPSVDHFQLLARVRLGTLRVQGRCC